MAYLNDSKVECLVEMVIIGGFENGALYSGVGCSALNNYVRELLMDEGVTTRSSLVRLIANKARFGWFERMRRTKKTINEEI